MTSTEHLSQSPSLFLSLCFPLPSFSPQLSPLLFLTLSSLSLPISPLSLSLFYLSLALSHLLLLPPSPSFLVSTFLISMSTSPSLTTTSFVPSFLYCVYHFSIISPSGRCCPSVYNLPQCTQPPANCVLLAFGATHSYSCSISFS